MFCPKCGTQNNGGNFCIACGNPLNIDKQAQISSGNQIAFNQTNQNNIATGQLILRRNGKVMGFAIDIHITINGVPYKLKAGDNLTFNLSPGNYQITYKVWCRREKAVSINVIPGNYYILDFVYDPLWGGFKLGKESKLQ